MFLVYDRKRRGHPSADERAYVPLGVKPMRVALGDVATLLSPSSVLVGRHCHVIPWVQGVLGHCHVQIPRRRTK